MEPKNASQTAVRTAMRRAAHYLLDEEPKILADPFARAFAGFSTDEEFLAAYDRIGSGAPWHRAAFALRNRLAEDELAKAVAEGTRQYVILGAGLDSFAYRQPSWMQSLLVYEVDHPASQAWKRERVAALGISTPPTLRYAPVDFNKTTLLEGLVTAGLNRQEPIFFSWLGVTQYLPRETGLRTLGEIASTCTAKSTAVVEFVAPPETLSEEGASLVRSIAAASAKIGEPWISFYTSEEMRQNLGEAGFQAIELFGPKEAFQLYLADRADGMRLGEHFRMAKASLHM